MNAVFDRYVYSIDNKDGTPCYIGIGKGRRIDHHMQLARKGIIRGNPRKCQHLIDSLADGFEPKPYKVAENLTIAQATAYEQFLIAWYGRLDLGTGTLLNSNGGGFGCRDAKQSTKNKISKAMSDRWNDPTFRANKIESVKRQWESQERRQAQSELATKLLIDPEVVAERVIKLHSSEARNKANEKNRTPEARSHMANKTREQMTSIDAREKASEKAKLQWKLQKANGLRSLKS